MGVCYRPPIRCCAVAPDNRPGGNVTGAVFFNPALVSMPDLDGWSVLAALRQDPQLAEIPVIMVTIVDEHRRGMALGAAGYLTKPSTASGSPRWCSASVRRPGRPGPERFCPRV
jgi:DNA-binding NarL/FixJ family response regulator